MWLGVTLRGAVKRRRCGGGGEAGTFSSTGLSQAKYSTGGVASIIIIARVEERARDLEPTLCGHLRKRNTRVGSRRVRAGESAGRLERPARRPDRQT